MRKVTLLLLALVFAFSVIGPVAPVSQAEAASKKKSKGRDDYTPEQRKKMMEQARKICVKNYGVGSRVYKLDYKKMTVTCTDTGW